MKMNEAQILAAADVVKNVEAHEADLGMKRVSGKVDEVEGLGLVLKLQTATHDYYLHRSRWVVLGPQGGVTLINGRTRKVAHGMKNVVSGGGIW